MTTDSISATANSDTAAIIERKQIRGSSLLVAGNLLSIGINFVTQVLLVRYLTTHSFGLWSYAISIVAFCKTFAPLGVDEALSRFVPIYNERGERGRMVGVILLAIGIVAASSAVVIISFYMAPHYIASILDGGTEPFPVLLIMIFLVPVETLDVLVMNLFACFARPRAIFFRRHVLAPGLRLTVVLALIAAHSNLRFLAYGYLAASFAGVVVYSFVLVVYLRREGLISDLNFNNIRFPFRELLGFSIPLMTTDLMTVVNGSVIVIILGHFHNFDAVAMYRVVLPAAALNKIVMTGFSLLYTPHAARLFARGDNAALNQLYWRTARWLGVASFPIFALTFCFAHPLTVFMFGDRYAGSSLLLALMSLGYYFNVATGFNGLTLKVYGRVRYLATLNVLTALCSIVLSILLIPRFGALGAAVSSATAMIIHNVAKQLGLRLASGIHMFDRECVPVYALILLSIFCLFSIQSATRPNIFVALVLVGLASTLVVVAVNRSLHLLEVFPEARRVPLLGRFFV